MLPVHFNPKRTPVTRLNMPSFRVDFPIISKVIYEYLFICAKASNISFYF